MEDEKRYQSNTRPRHGRGHRGGRSGQGHRSGRQQRPLLTSSINASGLCLVALVLAIGPAATGYTGCLSVAVIAFSVSSLISYFAQRTSQKWVEKTSDLFFFIGVLLIIYVAGGIAGFWNSGMI